MLLGELVSGDRDPALATLEVDTLRTEVDPLPFLGAERGGQIVRDTKQLFDAGLVVDLLQKAEEVRRVTRVSDRKSVV